MGQQRDGAVRRDCGSSGGKGDGLDEEYDHHLTVPPGDKGYLKTSKIGRRNRYTALVPEGDYQAVQTERFVDKIYEGNAKGLVAALIQKELLSAEDYEGLKAYWEKAGEQDG